MNAVVVTFLIVFLFTLASLGSVIFGLVALFTPTPKYSLLFLKCFITLVLIVIWVIKQPQDKEKTK